MVPSLPAVPSETSATASARETSESGTVSASGEGWAEDGTIETASGSEGRRIASVPIPSAIDPATFIIASHIFAGPQDIPPEGFLAYGVIAFPQKPTPDTEARYKMLCDAFAETISFSGDVAQPTTSQVVTIWPVGDSVIARNINQAPAQQRCALAVTHYNLPHSEYALEAARIAGQKLGTQRGPFLLAWYPGGAIGTPQVAVLDRDLSLVVTPQQAAAEFRAWKQDIKSHDCWDCLNARQRLRRNLRLYSDYLGGRIIGALRVMISQGIFSSEEQDA